MVNFMPLVRHNSSLLWLLRIHVRQYFWFPVSRYVLW
jgi:hypothetical protein